MAEVHSSVDRLDSRLDHLAARVEVLYSTLEARGILTPPPEGDTADALFDELLQIEDSPFARQRRTRPTRRRSATRLRVGSTGGV